MAGLGRSQAGPTDLSAGSGRNHAVYENDRARTKVAKPFGPYSASILITRSRANMRGMMNEFGALP